MCYVLPQTSICYMNVTFKDLLGWASKLELKKSLGDYAATHHELTPCQIDWLANMLEPRCTNYTREFEYNCGMDAADY